MGPGTRLYSIKKYGTLNPSVWNGTMSVCLSHSPAVAAYGKGAAIVDKWRKYVNGVANLRIEDG